MAEFYGVQKGSAQAISDNDQGNQNLPEVRRQDLFRRAGRALPQMRAEKCARQFPGRGCSRGRPTAGSAEAAEGRIGERMTALTHFSTESDSAAPLSCSESWAITNYWKRSVAAVRAWYFAPGRKVSTAQSH